jgi:hypothetical protein
MVKMVDFHIKTFFGQNSALTINSPSKISPYIFMSCFNRTKDGSWEEEKKTVKLSIEEIICILEVLKRNSANWRGYHVFKDYNTEIYVGWESEAREVLKISLGEYKKKLRFPNTNFLTLLLEHLLKEKIEYATSGTFETKGEKVEERGYGVFTEHITARDGLQVVETTEYGLDKEVIEIHVKIKIESPKALLITFDTGNEFWIPKSTIHNDYNVNDKESYQRLIVDKWIIEKNIIGIFDK